MAVWRSASELLLFVAFSLLAACGGGDDGRSLHSATTTSGTPNPQATMLPGTLAVGATYFTTAHNDDPTRQCLAWSIDVAGYEFRAEAETVPVAWDVGSNSREGTLTITELEPHGYYLATFSTADGDVRFSGGLAGIATWVANCARRR